MRRKILLVCVGVWMAASAMAQSYSGGEGTPENPFRISTVGDMEALADAVNTGTSDDARKCFLLTADLTDIKTIIGDAYANPFSGTFNGGGHRLTVDISRTTALAVGVFGYADGATILNLGVAGSVACTVATGYVYAGGICGYMADKGSITGCHNEASVSASSTNDMSCAGGICGSTYSPISNCYNMGNINSSSSDSDSDSFSLSGGICGYSNSSGISGAPISNCYNMGDINSSSSSDSYSGGICGYVSLVSPVSNCYNTGGTISSSTFSGGICGYSNSDLLNCFVANATITGDASLVGRISGYTYGAEPINNYAQSDIKVNGETVGNSDENGQGEDAANFKDLDWLSGTLHWDVSEWYTEGGFPMLKPSAYSGGIGTEGKPYRIASVPDMEALATAVNGGTSDVWKCFLLTADLTDITTIIGTDDTNPFRGTFDGGGHRLTVDIRRTTDSSVGVFGYANGAVIKNLGVTGSVALTTASGYRSCVGGICGYMTEGSMTACYNTAAVSAAASSFYSYAGGICGYAQTVAISNCYNTGAIDATTTTTHSSYSGGICGYGSDDSSVDNCYNTGAIATVSSHPDGDAASGGICGYTHNTTSVGNCYNTGAIASDANVSRSGGICGNTEYDSPVSNCYNTGAITSVSSNTGRDASSGGICGYVFSDTPVSNCYNTGAIASSATATSRSGGICGNVNNASTVSNCFAANATITTAGATQQAGRVVGYVDGDTSAGNYAYSGMLVNGETVYSSTNNGIDTGEAYEADPVHWVKNTFNWGFDESWYLPLLAPDLSLTLSTPSVTYGHQGDITFGATSQQDEASITYAYKMMPADCATVNVAERKITVRKAGTVTITATLASTGAYRWGAASKTLTINKAELTVTADNPPAIIYGNDPPSEYTFLYGDFVNGEDEDVLSPKPAFQCAVSNKSNAGDYDIVPADENLTADNYTFNFVKGTLTIDKHELTVTPAPATRTYGATDPAFELSYAGFVNDDDDDDIDTPPTATTDAKANSPVGGDYTITCSGGVHKNYTFNCAATAKLTITQAPLTITTKPEWREYGEKNPAFTITYDGFKNDEHEEEVLSALPKAVCEADETYDVGLYGIELSGGEAANYAISLVDGELTINQAPLTITANSYARIYGDGNPAFDFAFDGFKNAENASVLTHLTAICGATETSDVKTYPITVSVDEATNYAITTFPGVLTVTQAPLTVTAIDASRAYGDANPAFTLSYAGWKNAETKAVLTTEPVATCAADETAPVGTYPIIASGGEAVNYEFAYVEGTLTVLPVYAIHLPSTEGGVVTAAPSPSIAGARVTLRIVPENGYALSNIGVRLTAAPYTVLALSGEGDVRTFGMPAEGVTVSASFHKTPDRLAVEEAVRRLEGFDLVVSQETLNTEEAAVACLLDTLNYYLLADLGIRVPERNVWMYNFSKAVAGTPVLPTGRAGGFAATVSLSRNGNYGTEYVHGTILATRYVPVGIEGPQANALAAYVRGGTLYVSGLAAGEVMRVYDSSGKRVYRGTAAAVPLAVRGVYIIRTGTRSVRVVY